MSTDPNAAMKEARAAIAERYADQLEGLDEEERNEAIDEFGEAEEERRTLHLGRE